MKILTHNQHFKNIFSSVKEEKIPLLILVALFCTLTIITYGKWITIFGFDVNREFIVQMLIDQGFFIYKDFHYNYGPLIPFLLAIPVKIFGFSFELFYATGIFLAFIYMLVLYRAARLFLSKFYSTITGILFLLQCVYFNNAIFSFIVPYSYATVFCGILVIITIIFLIKHLESDNNNYLFIPFICCSICLLSKQDYFIISFGVITFYLGFYTLLKTDYSDYSTFFERIKAFLYKLNYKYFVYFALITGIPTALTYGLISLKTGIPRLILCLFPFENLKHPCVKDFIGITCKGTPLLANIIHFLFYATFSALALIILFYIIYICIVLFEKKKALKATLILLLVLSSSFLIIVKSGLLTPTIKLIIELKYIYSGINLWIILFGIFSIFKYGDSKYQKLILLIVTALLSNFRTFYGMDLAVYSFYYLPLSLIIFVILVNSVLPSLFEKVAKFKALHCLKASKILLIGICLTYFLLLLGLYKDRTYKISLDIGTFYQKQEQKEEIETLLEIADLIKSLTKKSDKIIVYPSRLELYVLTQRLPASKYYYLTPGTISHENEEFELIEELENNNPAVVVIAKNKYHKRSKQQKKDSMERTRKYNVNTVETELTFGNQNCHPHIYKWVKDNYTLHKEYLFNKFDPPLTIEVFTK